MRGAGRFRKAPGTPFGSLSLSGSNSSSWSTALLALAATVGACSSHSSTSGNVAGPETHFRSLRTIDATDEDFSDLTFFRRMLKDKDIVLLGEPNHGAGSAIAVRARLVKYLHEELDFDLLVYEASFFGCTLAWEAAHESANPQEVLATAVLPIWSRSEQGAPLFAYLAKQLKSANPLILAGVDPQLIIGGSAERTRQLDVELAHHLESMECAEGWTESTRESLVSLVETNAEATPEQLAELAPLVDSIRRARECLGAFTATSRPEDKASFWRQVLWNLEQLALLVWGDQSDPDIYNLRDFAMARNVDWIRQRYPGKRVIVWSANLHIARGLQGVSDHRGHPYSEYSPMGEILAKSYGHRLASIMVISRERRSRAGGVTRSDPTALGTSLETTLFSQARDVGFIDLRHWAAKRKGGLEFVAAPFGYEEQSANWAEVVDGFLFIPIMESGRFPPATDSQESP